MTFKSSVVLQNYLVFIIDDNKDCIAFNLAIGQRRRGGRRIRVQANQRVPFGLVRDKRLDAVACGAPREEGKRARPVMGRLGG